MCDFPGDFAVLLKAGMTVRQAILYNVLSALMAYLGMITGILIGHYADNISTWIFALTAGFFMYVALVDMVSHQHNLSVCVCVCNPRRQKCCGLRNNKEVVISYCVSQVCFGDLCQQPLFCSHQLVSSFRTR